MKILLSLVSLLFVFASSVATATERLSTSGPLAKELFRRLNVPGESDGGYQVIKRDNTALTCTRHINEYGSTLRYQCNTLTSLSVDGAIAQSMYSIFQTEATLQRPSRSNIFYMKTDIGTLTCTMFSPSMAASSYHCQFESF